MSSNGNSSVYENHYPISSSLLRMASRPSQMVYKKLNCS